MPQIKRIGDSSKIDKVFIFYQKRFFKSKRDSFTWNSNRHRPPLGFSYV